MRATAVVLSLLLLAACARSGDSSPMTPRDASDTAPSATTADDTATNHAGAAEFAPLRDVRTATFALG